MSNELQDTSWVAGQKYAYATASLLLGFSTFINLLSLEKAALAVAFGWLALRHQPSPSLGAGRGRAMMGTILGSLGIVAVPLFLALFHERVAELLSALRKMP